MPNTAILIPERGPIVYDLALNGTLDQLQDLVGGGLVQAIPVPEFIHDADDATAYTNEESKFRGDMTLNSRATDFMVPGAGLMWGDYIAGPFLICGFDPETGEHTDVPPASVLKRVQLIDREAGDLPVLDSSEAA